MKYIRTKDNSITHKETIEQVKDVDAYRHLFPYVEIVKVADTIKELCDGWVIECPEWEKPTFKRQLQFMNWQDYVKTANKHKVIHYAAIFVRLPNGAIRIEPVAKMNDKGELELL